MSVQPTSDVCSSCGAGLTASATPGGLCPRCLMRGALADVEVGDSAEGVEHPAGHAAPPTSAPSPRDLSTRLGARFEVQALLGQGAMGAVYRAVDTHRDRVVALKVLLPQGGASPEFEARFVREAEVLARLRHPGIVGVEDFGAADGLCYLVLEHVEGRTLREQMRSGPVQLEEARRIIGQLGEALQAAHDLGIVHRDVKPENVLVAADGRARLVDFGLARWARREGFGDSVDAFTLTRSGTAVGTPIYMAPEQLHGDGEVDGRADVYALGVLAYELLTGKLPLGRFEPPSSVVPTAVPCDKVVLRALANRPADRYASVRAFATEFCSGRWTGESPAPVGRSTGEAEGEESRAHRPVPLMLVVVWLASLALSWRQHWNATGPDAGTYDHYWFWSSPPDDSPVWIIPAFVLLHLGLRFARSRGRRIHWILSIGALVVALEYSRHFQFEVRAWASEELGWGFRLHVLAAFGMILHEVLDAIFNHRRRQRMRTYRSRSRRSPVSS